MENAWVCIVCDVCDPYVHAVVISVTDFFFTEMNWKICDVHCRMHILNLHMMKIFIWIVHVQFVVFRDFQNERLLGCFLFFLETNYLAYIHFKTQCTVLPPKHVRHNFLFLFLSLFFLIVLILLIFRKSSFIFLFLSSLTLLLLLFSVDRISDLGILSTVASMCLCILFLANVIDGRDCVF